MKECFWCLFIILFLFMILLMSWVAQVSPQLLKGKTQVEKTAKPVLNTFLEAIVRRSTSTVWTCMKNPSCNVECQAWHFILVSNSVPARIVPSLKLTDGACPHGCYSLWVITPIPSTGISMGEPITIWLANTPIRVKTLTCTWLAVCSHHKHPKVNIALNGTSNGWHHLVFHEPRLFIV